MGPMQEPLVLGFVINKGTDHPAHLHSLFSAFVCGKFCMYPI